MGKLEKDDAKSSEKCGDERCGKIQPMAKQYKLEEKGFQKHLW